MHYLVTGSLTRTVSKYETIQKSEVRHYAIMRRDTGEDIQSIRREDTQLIRREADEDHEPITQLEYDTFGR